MSGTPRPIRYGIHEGETYVVDPDDLGFCAGDIVKAPGSKAEWKISEIVSRPWRVANLVERDSDGRPVFRTQGVVSFISIRTGVSLSELLFVRRPAAHPSLTEYEVAA